MCAYCTYISLPLSLTHKHAHTHTNFFNLKLLYNSIQHIKYYGIFGQSVKLLFWKKNEGLWKVRKIQQEKSRLIQQSLKKKNEIEDPLISVSLKKTLIFLRVTD